MPDRLLIVEDDEGLRKQLKWSLGDSWEIHMAQDRPSAIAALRRFEPQVIILDLGLPPDPANASEGMAALAEIQKLSPGVKIIVVTGNDDREVAIKTIADGAYDFYLKPVDPELLQLMLQRAFHVWHLEEASRQQMACIEQHEPLPGFLAASPKMLSVCRMTEKVAPTSVTTLLIGESGTGKELVARALHKLGDRAKAPFVAINCAAIPENLLESELFGYEKGAFTGAVRQNRGKIEGANGGTLFLDEIGDLPLSLQAKLLRFIQERVVERVGGREEISVDVRIVCATHRDLSQMVESGDFRQDLYYRLSEITIDIPPLRDRGSDVILLANVILRKFSEGGQHLRFSEEAVKAMEHWHWPGNVRELENKIKRAAILAEGNWITPEDLELSAVDNVESWPLNLRAVREKAETAAIVRALEHAQGNMSKAAELLGVSRPTLYALLDKYHTTNSKTDTAS